MKVKIKQWNAIATWVWDINNETQCTICQLPFENPCPRCKSAGDDCPPSNKLF
jgi:anaphase-promoting complex subunit 11